MNQLPGGNNTTQEVDNKRTSVKVHAMPGGNSNLNLGWNNPTPVDAQPQNSNKYQHNKQSEPVDDKDVKRTSVKVHAPPGGKSNFTLG